MFFFTVFRKTINNWAVHIDFSNRYELLFLFTILGVFYTHKYDIIILNYIIFSKILKEVKIILKSKSLKPMLFSGICFAFAGIMYLISKNYFLGVFNIFIGGFFFVLGMTNYKGRNKFNQIEVSDEVLENMDVELRNLVAEGKKIEAIKKYRVVTGLGLKEAYEYVDLLSEAYSNK
jgi:amino acid transporter